MPLNPEEYKRVSDLMIKLQAEEILTIQEEITAFCGMRGFDPHNANIALIMVAAVSAARLPDDARTVPLGQYIDGLTELFVEAAAACPKDKLSFEQRDKARAFYDQIKNRIRDSFK